VLGRLIAAPGKVCPLALRKSLNSHVQNFALVRVRRLVPSKVRPHENASWSKIARIANLEFGARRPGKPPP
jgi:hypothetical protein